MARTETRYFALDTELRVRQPWGLYVGGRALCEDGKVRALHRIAATADTFFSVPAAVKVGGKTVSGFITVETVDGWSTHTPGDGDPTVVRFVAYTNRKNGHLLPNPWSAESKARMAAAVADLAAE